MNIVVAGGSGFIGTRLIDRLLKEGHSLVVLTRNSNKIAPGLAHVHTEKWNAQSAGAWCRSMDTADVVINLTGELIAGKRWTVRQKNIILRSRLDATGALVDAIRQAQRRPSVLVNISGVGFYGDVPAGDVLEWFPGGHDFLADVCREWEQAALGAQQYGVRVVLPRLGVVLGRDGGALPRMMLPFKMFAGGYLGSGAQWFPWVHLDDVVNVIRFAIRNTAVAGPLNVAAPEAVTMKTFCSTLGKVMHSPSWTFVPAFVLRAALGEMSGMLRTGQKAIPRRLAEYGFTFEHPSLRKALEDILHR